jgi:MFS family permease
VKDPAAIASMVRRNLRLILVHDSLSAFRTYLGLYFLFFRQIGLTLTQISLFWAINLASQVAADVFSSHLGDRFGYRRCLIGGALVQVVGLIGIATANSFWWLIVPCILWGLGSAFTFGNNTALAKESADHFPLTSEREPLFHRFLVRNQILFTAAMAGSCAADWGMLQIWPHLAPRLGFGIFGVCLATLCGLAFALKEPQEWAADRRIVQATPRLERQVGSLPRTSRLWLIVACGVILSLALELAGWLQPFYLQEMHAPSSWYPLIGGTYGLFSVPTTLVLGRWWKTRPVSYHWKAIAGLIMLASSAFFVLCTAPKLWGFMGFGMVAVIMGSYHPIISRHVTALMPHRKATVLSLITTTTQIVEIAVMPLVSWLAQTHSLRTALLAILLVLAPTSLMLILAALRQRQHLVESITEPAA